jgi:hypothetical protein
MNLLSYQFASSVVELLHVLLVVRKIMPMDDVRMRGKSQIHLSD